MRYYPYSATLLGGVSLRAVDCQPRRERMKVVSVLGNDGGGGHNGSGRPIQFRRMLTNSTGAAVESSALGDPFGLRLNTLGRDD